MMDMNASGPRQNLENQTLAKYQVIKQIGRGSMGTVYLGHDPFIDRPVAIKVAREAELADQVDPDLFPRMFFNEAQAAGMLKHPNITSIFDAGADAGTFYIVMEYVHGGHTLEHYCQASNLLPVNDAIKIVYKCAMALDYAHRHGVIHRDIKPRNILVTEDHDIKISDFGIAVIPGNTDANLPAHAGSPMYMAPEQIASETVSPQSDLFSLGVVMFELLSGKAPFPGESIAAINYRVMNSPPLPILELRAGLPPVLGRIINKALARDPARRYRTGLDLAGDLSIVFDFLEPDREKVDREERFRALRALDFFADFPDNELWELVNASSWQEIPSGQSIILEGEIDKSFYIIVDGEVAVSKGETTLDHLHKGDCFGEMGFVSGRGRTASIRATANVRIMKIQAPMIERASISCQLRFHKLFLHTLIERLARANDRVAGTGPG